MSSESTVGAIIRHALTYERERRGLSTDRALADELGIDPVTLWRWTQGEIGRAAEILVPIVAAANRTPEEPESVAA